MKLLVTAGNTQTPLDRVRCITNIFTGQTGTRIAREAHARGHDVCLLTSHPELARQSADGEGVWDVRAFKTFDDLQALMAETIPGGEFDAIVHCAAVSDYQLDGVFSTAEEANSFRTQPDHMQLMHRSTLVNVSAGKVKSSHQELWLRLIPTPKLVDHIRRDWHFRGVLVKFKLEVDVTDYELSRIANAARAQSDADLIVANTLEGMNDWALFIDRNGIQQRVARPELSAHLLSEIEGRLSGIACRLQFSST